MAFLFFVKRESIGFLSSSISRSSFAMKRNIVRFGGNRIKGSVYKFNNLNHDIMNVKTFNNVKKWRKFGKDVWKFGNGMLDAF